ncbi:MAG: hypothetical protein Q7T88_01445 [Methylotenera sp.]|jgi:hypothetical protein|nr:hypothetical protein [Methylotenera sp.]
MKSLCHYSEHSEESMAQYQSIEKYQYTGCFVALSMMEQKNGRI